MNNTDKITDKTIEEFSKICSEIDSNPVKIFIKGKDLIKQALSTQRKELEEEKENMKEEIRILNEECLYN